MTLTAGSGALTLSARPEPYEVVVAHAPAGGVVRVHNPYGYVEFASELPDTPLIVVVPGDREVLGWGVNVLRYLALGRIRNGRHKLDRAAWDQAHAAIRRGGLVYVHYEVTEYYGRPRWTATGIREAVSHG